MRRITIRKAMLAIALVAVGLTLAINWHIEPGLTRCGTPCPGRLRTVGRALVEYYNHNLVYPSGTYFNTSLSYDDRLSWYAELTPYVDNQEIHEQMSWDQRSNGGSNENLSRTILMSVVCTNHAPVLAGPVPTSYIGIAGVGPDAPLLPKSDARAGVFGYDRKTNLADIKDGTANTMAVAETARVSGSWLQGGPATVRGLDPAEKPYVGPNLQFGGLHDRGAWVAMADGSVRWVSDSISPAVFEALSTIAGGETLPRDWGEPVP
jgi:Protein of unknown function (DUF1559)